MNRLSNLSFLLPFLIPGCVVSTDIPDDIIIQCSEDSQCPSGFVCPAGQCFPESAIAQGEPHLQVAVADSEITVFLTFDKPLVAGPAENIENYTITPGIVVEHALLEDSQRVLLSVRNMVAGSEYTVTVDGLIGFSGQQIASDGNSQSFTGFGATADSSPPLPIFPARSSAQYIGYIGPIIVGWTPRSGAQSYTIELDDEPTFSVPLVYTTTVLAPTTTAELVGSSEDITYFWRVRANVTAENEWGCSSFERIVDTLYVYCDEDDCDSNAQPAPQDPCAALDVETGNRSTPFRSIQRAINAAAVYGIDTILVANHGGLKGYYEESLTIGNGIKVIGRYDAAFENRDAVKRTKIVGVTATTARISGVPSDLFNVGPSTLLDGLEIEASLLSNPEPSLGLEISGSGNGLLIEDCVITAKGSQRNIGMRVAYWDGFDGGSVISNSIIQSIVSDGSSYGSALEFTEASLTISNSTLNGPDGIRHRGYDLRIDHSTITATSTTYGTAIDVMGSDIGGYGSLFASDNIIKCLGNNDECYGVVFREALNLDLQRNIISIGPSNSGYGVWIEHPWSMDGYSNGDQLLLHNNIVVMADATFVAGFEDTAAFYLKNAGASIAHNTVIMGGGSAPNGAAIMLVELANPVVYNNIFYIQPGSGLRAVVIERGAPGLVVGDADVRSMGGNIFAAASWSLDEDAGSSLVYWDSDSEAARLAGGTGSASIAPNGINGGAMCSELSIERGQGQECLTQGSTVAEANSRISITLGDLFTDALGPDSDLGAVEDGDFSLKTNDTAITGGTRTIAAGDGTALVNCGGIGENSTCPTIAGDFTSAGRTLPYSAGAYEKD